jgi:DNA-binding MarR family transcriptional regulator
MTNPEDGRGVLIFLTEFGREKRAYSKERLLTFNDTIRIALMKKELNIFISEHP